MSSQPAPAPSRPFLHAIEPEPDDRDPRRSARAPEATAFELAVAKSGTRPAPFGPSRDLTDPASRILGVTTEVLKVREQLRRVAEYPDVSVLILGETGTGKELVASAIHELTHRFDGPSMVGINCAALPESLVESELFGHEAGSFTGAKSARQGLFEVAQSGTVFLDEIGEMPGALQTKLLRVLEMRWFRRVGSNRDIPLEARIVSATNRSVRSLRRSSLRPDLFYRLAGFAIELPPLRERKDDVPILATHFLDQFAHRYQRGPMRIASAAIDVLRAHRWPGNVRELRGVIEHGAILCRDDLVTSCDVRDALEARPSECMTSSLPPRPDAAATERISASDDEPTLRDVERDLIVRAFEQCGSNVSEAARKLGIARSTMRDKLRRYGLV